jgi:hypothetical protein
VLIATNRILDTLELKKKTEIEKETNRISVEDCYTISEEQRAL